MRIAFFSDPYICSQQNFYQKVLLKDELVKRGHHLEIHIPIPTSKFRKKYKTEYYNYVAPFHNERLGFPITWDKPDVEAFDALILVHHPNKKCYPEDADYRVVLSKKFNQQGKPVIILKDDLSLEYHRVNNKDVHYGVFSLVRPNLKERIVLPETCDRFLFPVWGAMTDPRPGFLKPDQFYQEYQLDPQLKLITFFMPKYQKVQALEEFQNPYVKTFLWLMNHLTYFTKILAELGFQLIFKSHRGDRDNFFRRFDILDQTKFRLLKPIHTYESIKYSDFAMTCFSNVCYELYLNQLPVIEIGSGVYYPGWWDQRDYDPNTFFPYQGFKGPELIWGTIVSHDDLTIKPWRTFKRILNQEYHIEDFPYLHNHPIYGDSYGATISQVADRLLEVFLSKDFNSMNTKQILEQLH